MSAILYGNTVWEGKSTEPFPTEEEGAKDGHYIKMLDSGESYIRVDGEWQYINLGLAFIKATKSGRIITNENGIYDVIFNTPFINDDYTVALSTTDVGNKPNVVYFSDLTANGFRITSRTIEQGKVEPDVIVSWLATRNYNP